MIELCLFEYIYKRVKDPALRQSNVDVRDRQSVIDLQVESGGIGHIELPQLFPWQSCIGGADSIRFIFIKLQDNVETVSI